MFYPEPGITIKTALQLWPKIAVTRIVLSQFYTNPIVG